MLTIIWMRQIASMKKGSGQTSPTLFWFLCELADHMYLRVHPRYVASSSTSIFPQSASTQQEIFYTQLAFSGWCWIRLRCSSWNFLAVISTNMKTIIGDFLWGHSAITSASYKLYLLRSSRGASRLFITYYIGSVLARRVPIASWSIWPRWAQLLDRKRICGKKNLDKKKPLLTAPNVLFLKAFKASFSCYPRIPSLWYGLLAALVFQEKMILTNLLLIWGNLNHKDR